MGGGQNLTHVQVEVHTLIESSLEAWVLNLHDPTPVVADLHPSVSDFWEERRNASAQALKHGMAFNAG